MPVAGLNVESILLLLPHATAVPSLHNAANACLFANSYGILVMAY